MRFPNPGCWLPWAPRDPPGWPPDPPSKICKNYPGEVPNPTLIWGIISGDSHIMASCSSAHSCVAPLSLDLDPAMPNLKLAHPWLSARTNVWCKGIGPKAFMSRLSHPKFALCADPSSQERKGFRGAPWAVTAPSFASQECPRPRRACRSRGRGGV